MRWHLAIGPRTKARHATVPNRCDGGGDGGMSVSVMVSLWKLDPDSQSVKGRQNRRNKYSVLMGFRFLR